MSRYAYVLVSPTLDRYVSMCLLSALSVRGVDPTARISLVTDASTAAALHARSHPLLAAVDNVVSENLPGKPQFTSRILKTTLLQRLNEDFIFLDTDTIVMRPIAHRFDRPAPMQLALDRFPKFPRPGFPQWATQYFEQLGWRYPTAFYYNSGVMFVRRCDQTLRLFEDWHRRWRAFSNGTGKNNDQPALNSAIDASGIHIEQLPVRYNAMVRVHEHFRFGACVIHFFSEGTGTDAGTEYERLLTRTEAGEVLSAEVIRNVLSRRVPLVDPKSVKRQLLLGHPLSALRHFRRKASGGAGSE